MKNVAESQEYGNRSTETGEWREVFDFRYAYCPLCGAKMESEEE